jgi:hypothetical protein
MRRDAQGVVRLFQPGMQLLPQQVHMLAMQNGTPVSMQQLKKMQLPTAGSPVTISSGLSLGQRIFVASPPSTSRTSGQASSDLDERFFSASSDERRSNGSSTYFSATSLTSTDPRSMSKSMTD